MTARVSVVFATGFAAALALSASGCRDQSEPIRTAGTGGVALPADSTLQRIPLGDVAGVASNAVETTVRNPYQGNQAAQAEGKELFTRMNCTGCHGYDAKGGMGPNLTDTYWRYGGSPAAIYNSISAGRPMGMPAWGVALPREAIWKLVAYVQSLGGAFPARLAISAHEGNLGGLDSGAASTLKGRQNDQ